MLDVHERTVIWVPAVAFALAYSLFFICSALTTLNPKAWSDAKALLFSRWKAKRGLKAGQLPDACAPPSAAGAAAGNGGGGGSAESTSDQTLCLAQVAAPVVLSWEGLGCSYNTPEGIKPVLQDVSGEAHPREMLALMGPSGSGKSTLMDMLAARKSLGRLSGAVKVNGVPRGSGFRRMCSYVPQDDNLLPIFTVVETCRLYAALTLPRGTPAGAASARADEVLAAMGMHRARDRLVGGVLPGGLLLRGLSGGERKRLWVAVGILATPSVVFLDEPTTGLDSSAAVAVVGLLRRTARDSGLTVIASVHQPCSAVWSAFDSCAVLAHGLLMYCGPCGEMAAWFEKGLGLGPWNPAVHGIVSDWAMDLVSIEFQKPEGAGRTIESQQQLEAAALGFTQHYWTLHGAHGDGGAEAAAAAAAAAAYSDADPPHVPDTSARKGSRCAARSAELAKGEVGGDGASGAVDGVSQVKGTGGGLAVAAQACIEVPEGGAAVGAGAAAAGLAGDLKASWWTQFRTLLRRELLSTMRNPLDVAGRMFCFCLLAVFTGLVFWNQDEGVDGMRNKVNLLYIHTMFLLLMPFVYMTLYAQDKRNCVADLSSKLYGVSAYYAAKQLAVLPFIVANVVASDLIGVGMIGLRTDPGAVATFCGIGVVYYALAQQVQAFAATVTPNQEGAFVVTILFTSVNLLFSNFIIRFVDMQQSWLSALRYVSACNFAFSALLRNQFGGTVVSCASGFPPELVSTLQALMPRTALLRSKAVEKMLTHPGDDCVMDLNAVLDYFGVSQPVWVYGLAILAYLLVVHAATFCGLLMLAKKERR